MAEAGRGASIRHVGGRQISLVGRYGGDGGLKELHFAVVVDTQHIVGVVCEARALGSGGEDGTRVSGDDAVFDFREGQLAVAGSRGVVSLHAAFSRNLYGEGEAYGSVERIGDAYGNRGNLL